MMGRSGSLATVTPMNLKRLTDRARQAIEERGGTERLKADAERLRDIAAGPGTAKQKAKEAGDALREPAPAATRDTPTSAERPDPSSRGA